MKSTSLLHVLSAESLKLRGTLALWMCLIAPGLVVAVFVLQMLVINLGKGPTSAPHEAWLSFVQGVLALWAFLMLPLFVTLEAALLGALEHGNHQWKHLLALAVPRQHHYLAKWFALIGLLLLASIALMLCVLGGWALQFSRPAVGIAGSPPLRLIVTHVAAIAAAALLIVSLHTWMALRWKSFTAVVSVGMGATVAGFLIGQSKDFGYLFPWTMPMHTLAGDGARMALLVVAGLISGALVTIVGIMDFLRREQD
jgi:lantibiotic transport system permease protein